MSTQQEAESRSGIEAQREAITCFMVAEGLEPIGEFVEGCDTLERWLQLTGARWPRPAR